MMSEKIGTLVSVSRQGDQCNAGYFRVYGLFRCQSAIFVVQVHGWYENDEEDLSFGQV